MRNRWVLTSALNHLQPQIKSTEDKDVYNKSVFGIEKKAFPYLLSITNLLLHDIDDPMILHGNSLDKMYVIIVRKISLKSL